MYLIIYNVYNNQQMVDTELISETSIFEIICRYERIDFRRDFGSLTIKHIRGRQTPDDITKYILLTFITVIIFFIGYCSECSLDYFRSFVQKCAN